MMINDTWAHFLQTQGATRTHGITTSFAHSTNELTTLESIAVIADLSHNAIIAVNGTDATKFLQNQLTNDIGQVSNDLSQISGYCTPKGRLLCIFRIFQYQDKHHLVLPRSLTESIFSRLRKYVLMSKVEFEHMDEHWCHFGVAGNQTVEILRNILGVCPTQVHGCTIFDGGMVIRLPGPRQRFQIVGQIASLIELWKSISKEAVPIGYHAWNWLEIEAGIPQVYKQTAEEFIPQTVNFDAIGGLSFTKGCYPGQEIVARMNYLGSIKRRMHLLHSAGSNPPEPGQSIYCDTAASEEIVGKVVAAECNPKGGIDLLAVVQIKYVDQGNFRIGSMDGEKLVIQDLPYELPQANNTKSDL